MANYKKVVEESKGFDKFIGIGAFELVAVNPNKAELEKLFGREVEKTPEYLTIDNETGVKGVRIDFYLKRVPCNGNTEEFDMLHKVAFFLKDTKIYGKEGASIKVINKYGKTTFIPVEHFEAHTVPENQSWFGTEYTECYPGQEELINFAVAYFAVPSLTFMKPSGEIVTIKDPKDAEIYFEDVRAFFNQNFSELKEFMKYPNKIKLLIGIKSSEDNKVYQDTFMGHFLKINTTSTKFLEKLVAESKAAGRYPNTLFEFTPLHIYTETAATFTPNSTPISTIKAPVFGGQPAQAAPAAAPVPKVFGMAAPTVTAPAPAPVAAEVTEPTEEDLPF